MSDEKKIRICVRKDGAVFPYSEGALANPNIVSGWQVTDKNGKVSITADRSIAQDLDPSTLSQREKGYIDRIAELEERLAAALSMPSNTPAEQATGPAVEAPAPTPLVETDEVDLDAPIPKDEPIQFEPEDPESVDDSPKSHQDFMKMKNDELIVFATRKGASVPEDAGRPELIKLCKEAQSQAPVPTEG